MPNHLRAVFSLSDTVFFLFRGKITAAGDEDPSNQHVWTRLASRNKT